MASTPTSPSGTDWRTSTWSSRSPGRRSSIHSPGPRPSGTQALSGSPSRAWEARAPTSSKKREEESATTRAGAQPVDHRVGQPRPGRGQPADRRRSPAGRQPQLAVEDPLLVVEPVAGLAGRPGEHHVDRGRVQLGPVGGDRAPARRRRVCGRRATWRTSTPGTPTSQKPTGLSPTPRTWVISTVTLEVVASGTSTLTRARPAPGPSTWPASTRTRTPATWTPGSDRTGRRTIVPTSTGSRRRVIDWPTPPPKSPVVQAVRRSPSKASSGLPNGVAVSSEPDPVAVTEAAPSRRVTVWVSGSPNRAQGRRRQGLVGPEVGE